MGLYGLNLCPSFHHLGPTWSSGSSRKGGEYWPSWTHGSSWKQRDNWRPRCTGNSKHRLEVVRSANRSEVCPHRWSIFKRETSSAFLYFIRVHLVNLDLLVLQALQDLPPMLWKTSLAWLIMKGLVFTKRWSSQTTMKRPTLLHLQSSMKTKLCPIRTQLSCTQTLVSRPPWRPSVGTFKTCEVQMAARWTLQRPARTSSSATLRWRAVGILF